MQGVETIRDPHRASRRAVLGGLATTPLVTGTTLHAQRTQTAPSTDSATVTPEQFGAIGNGVANDAPALQRAMNAVAAREPGGTVVLQPAVAYRCDGELVLDAARVSLWGHALLDFSGWQGRCLTVTASSIARGFTPANTYGHHGTLSGTIRLRGSGATGNSIGIDFTSSHVATSAQLLLENVTVYSCGIGIRFGDRAYNSLLLHCDVFDCGICIDYPAAEDNGERNTLVGCTLFNAGLAVRMGQSSGSLQLQGCSLDYTRGLYDVRGGVVLATSCHHESDRWDDRPVRCGGDGSLVRFDGGWILNRKDAWQARHFAEVGSGAFVQARDMVMHNLALAAPDPSRAPAMATGAGGFAMTGTQGFDLGLVPPRLHNGRSRVSDPDFHAVAWEDPVWRLRDTTMPIGNRHGAEGDNLRLAKTAFADETALIAAKAYGATSAASFVLIALAVISGEQVLAGFRARRDPRRPGSVGTLFVSPGWVKIDGQDEHRLPIIVRTERVGTLTVTPPTDRFIPISPLHARAQRTAPSWATHFLMEVDLVGAHQASFLFNGLWADTI